MKTPPPPAPDPLPFLPTFDDALALAEQTQDAFYAAAFLFQFWLGQLLQYDAAEYAEKKNPKERSLQSGEAYRLFRQIFSQLKAVNHQSLLRWLCRFAAAEFSERNLLRIALSPLAVEASLIRPHPPSAPQPAAPVASPESSAPADPAELDAQRNILRWCDWLEAVVHQRTHFQSHLAPACFDPDPETRYLAQLGNTQRHLAQLEPKAFAAWLLELSSAARIFETSPKWAAVGKAMAAATGSAGAPAGAKSQGPFAPRTWLYPDIDSLVIGLWPLVKAYNWTYRDLLRTLRPALKRPDAYPADTEHDFSSYVTTVLGLRKSTKGASTSNPSAALPGIEVAYVLSPALKPKQP